MGQEIHVRQGKAGQPAFIVRRGLSRLLRLGIDVLGAVHAPGTDAYDHPGKALQRLSQADFPEEGVLGRHMTAGQENQVALPNQSLRILGVVTVQNVIGLEGDSRLRKGGCGIRSEPAGVRPIFRVGGDEQRPGVGGKDGTNPVNEFVVIAEQRPVGTNHIGAAGKKQNHGHFSLGMAKPGKYSSTKSTLST